MDMVSRKMSKIVNGIEEVKQESEILLDRGMEFTINKIDLDNNIVKMTYKG